MHEFINDKTVTLAQMVAQDAREDGEMVMFELVRLGLEDSNAIIRICAEAGLGSQCDSSPTSSSTAFLLSTSSLAVDFFSCC